MLCLSAFELYYRWVPLKCLRIDLAKIHCCLNVPFIIWFLYACVELDNV